MTHEKTPLLDHGYIQLIDVWGSDERIIESARMSTAKGFISWNHYRQCRHCEEVDLVDAAGTSSLPGGCSALRDIAGMSVGLHDWRDVPDGDTGLLRFLWKNAHSTPFEMGGLTIEVQAPIFVFREWHRHRVPFGYNELCLTGDTEITCIGSGGLTRHYTIEHIWQTKHVGVVDHVSSKAALPPGFTRNGYSRAGTPVQRARRSRGQAEGTRLRKLPNCQTRTLRVLDESTELYETAPMLDVWQAGVQEVFLVKSQRGHQLKASANHPFYTREGWKRVSELRPGDMVAANGLVAAMERPVPPALRAGIGVWTTMMRSRLIRDEDKCYVCGERHPFDELELDHVVPVITDLRRALDEENLRPICERCHHEKIGREQSLKQTKTRLGLRWVLLDGRPERVGEEMTYDIEVDGPHKNFVANGLVVHNSARYTPLPDVNYVPTLERCMLGSDGKNKQAGTVKNADELTDVAAEAWRITLEQFYKDAEKIYQHGLKIGLPKELARIVVPVGRYSRMRATGNLRGWLAFMKLRSAPSAQWEIRQFSLQIGELVRQHFPHTHELFAGAQ